MGAYVGESDLIPSYIEERIAVQLTNDEPDGTTVVSAVVDDMIADAEAEVDGFLGARYALPLATVPRLVRQLAARVSRYRLYARRPGAIEDWLQKDYDAACKVLAQISKGTVTLGLQPEASPNPDRTAVTTSTPPIFGRGNLDVF